MFTSKRLAALAQGQEKVGMTFISNSTQLCVRGPSYCNQAKKNKFKRSIMLKSELRLLLFTVTTIIHLFRRGKKKKKTT